MTSKLKLMAIAGAAGMAMSMLSAPASAYTFDFLTVAEGQSRLGSGPFHFSYWHEATSNGGKSGDIVAVFGDNPSGSQVNTTTGSYDTVTGAVTDLQMLIYLPAATDVQGNLSNPSGAPVGILTLNGNLGGLGDWNGNDNGELGALIWKAEMFDNTNSVSTWLNGNGFATSFNGTTGFYEATGMHRFNDKFYTGYGPSMNEPNSIDVDEGADTNTDTDNSAVISLWGGDLIQPGVRNSNGGYIFNNANTTLGFDALFALDYGGGGTSVVPEPVSLAIFGLGLAGFGLTMRRRSRL